jgi:hypothetical protein
VWGFVLQGQTGILALHMCSIFALVQLATFLTWHGDLILIMRILFVCPSLVFHQGWFCYFLDMLFLDVSIFGHFLFMVLPRCTLSFCCYFSSPYGWLQFFQDLVLQDLVLCCTVNINHGLHFSTWSKQNNIICTCWGDNTYVSKFFL